MPSYFGVSIIHETWTTGSLICVYDLFPGVYVHTCGRFYSILFTPVQFKMVSNSLRKAHVHSTLFLRNVPNMLAIQTHKKIQKNAYLFLITLISSESSMCLDLVLELTGIHVSDDFFMHSIQQRANTCSCIRLLNHLHRGGTAGLSFCILCISRSTEQPSKQTLDYTCMQNIFWQEVARILNLV